MKKQKLPIGISDFKKMISQNFYYIDKTLFIQEIIEESAEVVLLHRPRRFGKTLNLSMLRYFFEMTPDAGSAEDNRKLFKGLAIEKTDVFDEFQGKYPVIWMTFKDVKSRTWPDCLNHLQKIIFDEYERHRYLLDGNTLSPEEKTCYQKILDQSAQMVDYERSLGLLSKYLQHFYNQSVIILIDEYDTPLHAGHQYHYYEDAVSFMRNFLSGGLKDNIYLFRGFITGILRIAKESIFSGLNNPGVYTLLDKKFSDAFGFTETDVRTLLKDFNMVNAYEQAAYWYNGYNFRGQIIFNPWSILNFIENKGEAKAYWINTADTTLIDKLATRGGKEIRDEIGLLLEGKTVELPVYETLVMRDLDIRDDLLWTFLVFSGYLNPVKETDYEMWELAIPNREVRLMYEKLIKTWFAVRVGHNHLNEMQKGLETGDVTLFERMLESTVLEIMSYHDLSGESEKVYHALVLGMLVWMAGAYDIRSNRESGYGRYDIMLKPKDRTRPGIIIEFKKIEKKDKNTHEKTLDEALKQIKDRGYAAELTASGITDILEIAVAFQGKKLWVKHQKSAS